MGFVRKNRFSSASRLSWYEFTWPQELEAKEVHAWLQALGGNKASNGVRFFVLATHDSIKHYIALPSRHQKSIIRSIHSFLPNLELASTEAVVFTYKTKAKLRMTTKNRVLDTGKPEVVSHAILSALQALEKGESVILEWVLSKNISPNSIPTNFTSFRSASLVGAVFEALAGGSPTKLDATALRSMRAKHEVGSWKCALFIGANARTKVRRIQLLGHIVGAIKSLEAPGIRIGSQALLTGQLLSTYSPIFWPLVINVNELVGLLSWPLGSQHVNGLPRILSRQLPVPSTMPTKGRVIGISPIINRKAKLVLPASDATRHVLILGPTGTGKSNLALNLITKDIADNRAVIILDTKGDLIQNVLERVPENRQKDVVVLNPSDQDFPVGFNPLAYSGRPPSIVADDIVGIFKKLYSSYFGDRTQHILRAGVLTLLTVPHMSLCALPLLYTDDAFRYRLTSKINDPLGLGSFWQWYDNLSLAERNAILPPILNKLRDILLSPHFQLVLGQGTPKFTLYDVFTKRKILLCNLSKGYLGSEASRLFGALLITQLWPMIQSRAKIPAYKRHPVFIYADDFPDYLHTPIDFAEMLEQARSYGISLNLFCQNLGQLPKELKSGVLANARTKICFQISREDAVIMARNNKQLTPEDFENLPLYHFYGKLVHNGRVSSWMSGMTLPPSEVISDPEAIKALSKEQYGRNVAEVRAELTSLITPLSASVQNTRIGRKLRGSA